MSHHKPFHNTLPLGSALEHGAKHAFDHERWSRRAFLYSLGAAWAGALMLGRLPIRGLAASPLAIALESAGGDNILVLIRLKGGNDGLNTIVPVYDYSRYRSLRPTLAWREQDLIDLGEGLAMPNVMAPLRGLWDEGRMKVAQRVGYPEQNLSHFRSSDIWASASDAAEEWKSGWMGRWLDGEFPEYLSNPPSTPAAVQIGGSGNLMFQNEDNLNLAVVVGNPEELAELARNGELYDAADVPDCYYGEQLTFLRTIANSTFRHAEALGQAYENGRNAAEYQRGLGEQLAIVARLIKGGLGTRLYMVTLDGFDTHARQGDLHPGLLRQMAQAVRDFHADLGVDAGRVLTMTLSEFGRRLEQNASGGTDHGAAAPLFLFGPGLNGSGFVGAPPELNDVDAAGNLRYALDFRGIYATVLESWLCVDAATVDRAMGRRHERLPALGLNCLSTSATVPRLSEALRHWVALGEGRIFIHFELPEAAMVRVRVFNMLGQPAATLLDGRLPAGEHMTPFQPGAGRLAAGAYVYTIEAGTRKASGKMIWGG
jgi:uncharacterized protein (DUF1501 family)